MRSDIWGFADIEAAIAAIPDWIHRASWNGPSVDENQWLVAGHSNGGKSIIKDVDSQG